MWDTDSQKPPKGRFSTPPFDPRFPNQNQARNCYQNFLDFHRCVKSLNRRGKSAQSCEDYFRVFRSLCPKSWVSRRGARAAEARLCSARPAPPCAPPQGQRWNEQTTEGTFAGKLMV
ncbi:cytochrome c oxidase subunit 6B2 [Manis pentadactyla]|uniref:cytochrome c oxidase subunit 6B2 n=1 Tax=Manis pentadactyla TaxID=143292 RepID=UPI00255C9BF3|nr:cytochrome c oxidase subunit 6B2 [Manis pentadactyla]